MDVQTENAILIAVREGFGMMNGRFDDMNKRFDETNQRISETNKRIDDFRFDVNQRFDETNKRIDETNKRIDETNSKVDDFRFDVNQRFEAVHKSMDQQYGSLEKRFEEHKQYIENILRSELGRIDVQIQEINCKLDQGSSHHLEINKPYLFRLSASISGILFVITICIIAYLHA